MEKFIDLQLFAEGGAVPTGESTAQSAADSNEMLANVRYGKQAEPSPAQQTGDATEDRSARFEELIKGDYKEAFQKKTQGIIDKRFAETKALESYRDNVSPIVDLLYQKYGVSDLQALNEAINNDSSYWEAAAEAEGLTVEQYKTKRRLEAENSQLRKAQEQQVRERQVAEQYQQWIAQGEEVKKAYPQFDLESEAKNPKFVDLLVRGIDVQTAFEVIHMNDIKMMSANARQKAVVNSVRANGLRPSENGAQNPRGVVTKTNVGELSKKDRAEIIRRVQRGEHIEF